MPKAKQTKKTTFNKMTLDNKIKEVKSLAKRANVRLALLEENKLTKTQEYKKTAQFNKEQGKKKNRFYEGTKYKTAEQVEKAYNSLSSFLNSKQSTLSGIKQSLATEVKSLLRQNKLTNAYFQKKTEKEIGYILPIITKKANRMMGALEKAGIKYYAIAQAKNYLKTIGKTNERFYTGQKTDKIDVKEHIQNALFFINSDTSTPKKVDKIVNKRIETFRSKGIPIGETAEEQKQFFDFLSSKQFTAMGYKMDSNQIAKTYAVARKKGVAEEDIFKEFQKFKSDELTEDEVQERLGIAPWQTEVDRKNLLH